MSLKNVKTSMISILIVVLTAAIIDLSLQKWEKDETVISWDIHNYYAYLPLVFIYDDIHLEKDDYRQEDNTYWFWPIKTDDGRNVIKGPIGMSYVYAPFFFIAHAIALLTGLPPTGFSEIYKFFLLLSSLIFLLIGLIYVRKTLLHFRFSERVVSLTIISVGLGTNLLAYSSSHAPMPHVYNFTLIAIFIFFTIKWHIKHQLKYIIILGLVLGLITVIRANNILVLLFFILYGVSGFYTLKEKFKLFYKEFFKLILFIPLGFLLWIPQFWYWKVSTGNFIYYSFGDEGFFFLDPKVIEGLFSFRKGWLLYTPIMTFALLGIFFLKNSLKKTRASIFLFTSLNIYIAFSWWCWWYGGTFGQRTMIDSYAVLAIPMAAFIQKVETKKALNYFVLSIGLFFIWLNIFQTYQFERESLHWDSMSKELYFKQFGKLEPIDNFYELLDPADYEWHRYRKNQKETK